MKRLTNFTSKCTINLHALNTDVANIFVPPVYSTMLHEEYEGTESIQFLSDVYLLFNQERLLKNVGSDTYKEIIDSFKNNIHNDESELRRSISEDQLFEFVKSRHYQSPSELKAWTHYLSNNFEYEYEKYMKKRTEELERLEKEAKEKRDKELEEYLKRKNSSSV